MSDDEPAEVDRRQRAAYRTWLREHHPDRGGDPTAFAEGLQRWQRLLRQPAAGPGAGPAAGALTFHRTRRRGPLAWWAARRRERARPSRVR